MKNNNRDLIHDELGEQSVVTVGITTYNRPDNLRQTLECLIGQTYENLKIVISDNCSPDPKTGEVANIFAKKDPRVEYVRHANNKGYFANFTYLIERAESEYFMWAADDDQYDPQYIEVCVDKLKIKPNCGLVFTGYKIISNKDKKRVHLNHNYYLRCKHKKTIFLLLDECLTHKANLLYGVWRTKTIKNVMNRCIECGINEQHVGKGFDNAFLTMTMGMTEAYQIQKNLFIKRYIDRDIPGSWKTHTKCFLRNSYRFIRNPVGYCRVTMNDAIQQHKLIESVYNEPNTFTVRLVCFLKIVLYIIFRRVF